MQIENNVWNIGRMFLFRKFLQLWECYHDRHYCCQSKLFSCRSESSYSFDLDNLATIILVMVAFSSLQNYTKKKHSANISNIIFNLHRLTGSFLICCSLLTASRQYFGTFINCMLSMSLVPLSVFDCSKHSFLTFNAEIY